MRVLIAGASGFLGTHLTTELRNHGHEVTALTRGVPGPGRLHWDPYAGTLDTTAIENCDVVVNLAGSPTLGNPHSKKWARALHDSRVRTTQVLADAIATSDRKPAFLAGNGISYYGDHGDRPVPETAESLGDAFLTEVTRDWQHATDRARAAGARVCILRTAPVLDQSNAPLKQLLVLFKTGLGGRLGSGKQYFPMISLRDWTAAVRFLAEREDAFGPFNLCCPAVPTNDAFTRALADLVNRPAFVPVPSIVLDAAAGRMAPELLGSVRAVPQALLNHGFRFSDPDVVAVLDAATTPR